MTHHENSSNAKDNENELTVPINSELQAQIEEAANLLSNNFLGSSEPRLDSYDSLQSTLLNQSQESQAALDNLEQIENLGVFNDNSQSSLSQLTNHLSDTFKQVDQLEKVLDFVERKANALDLKIQRLDQEQQAWLKQNDTSKFL